MTVYDSGTTNLKAHPTDMHVTDVIPTTAKPYEALAERLRSHGQRATPQRLAILSAFGRVGEHLTADEVFERVTHLAPAMNRSTVYRTLETFRDIGLVSETDLGGGFRRFELLDDIRHHHLVCRECNEMIDLPDDLIRPIRTRIAADYGYVVSIDHLALFGLCAYCAKSDS